MCYLFYISGERIRQIPPKSLDKLERDIMDTISKMAEKARKELPASMIEFLRLGEEAAIRAEKLLQRMAKISGKIYRVLDKNGVLDS